MTMLVITRPEPAGQRFLKAVEAAMGRSVPVIMAPLIEIEQIDVEPLPQRDGAVILTSENGVDGAVRLGLAGTRAWCVGNRTAQAARAAGFDAVSADGDVGDLARLLAGQTQTGALTYVHGEQVAGDLVATLAAHGVACAEVVTYRQIILDFPPALTHQLRKLELLVVPLFSPRSAKAFSDRLVGTAPICAIALSDSVAKALDSVRITTLLIADAPNASHMVELTCQSLGKPSQPALQP